MAKYIGNTKLHKVAAILLGSSLLAPLASAGEFSGEVGVANDYRFRGVSQTDSGLQAFGGIDYAADSGFFVGAFATNVDFGEDNASNIELDLYGGYYHEVNDNLSFDFTVYRYSYFGENSDSDYFEATVGADFSGFRAAYWFTNDFGGTSLAYHYVELNYGWEFAKDWSLDLHLGNNTGDALSTSYIDYSIGVSTELAGFGLSLAWLDTNLSGDEVVTEDLFNSEGTVLASVTYAF